MPSTWTMTEEEVEALPIGTLFFRGDSVNYHWEKVETDIYTEYEDDEEYVYRYDWKVVYDDARYPDSAAEYGNDEISAYTHGTYYPNHRFEFPNQTEMIDKLEAYHA